MGFRLNYEASPDLILAVSAKTSMYLSCSIQGPSQDAARLALTKHNAQLGQMQVQDYRNYGINKQ